MNGYCAYFLSAFVICSVFAVHEAYGTATSPILQIKSGIPLSDVVCNEDLVRLTHPTKETIRCVKASSVDFFVSQGWATAPDLAPQVPEISDTLKSISIIKSESIGVKKSTTAVYDYVFEVCAGSVTFVAPEVIIKSDVQTKTVTLANDIPKNSCLTTVTSITAVSSDSIKAELAKQDDIVAKISSIKSDIDAYAKQLDEEKINFAQILAQNKTADKQQKLDESITKINTLRQSANDLKDDLNRYYFILYGPQPSKSSALPKTSFTGSEISGDSVKIISITNNAKTSPAFDVALEVCAGEKSISAPIVELSSDTKKTILKLSAVTANSCYVTGAKIESNSADSITAKFTESTSAISSIETIIKNLEDNLSQKRTELSDLTQKATSPDAKQIRKLSNEITALRDDLVKAKSLYYNTLYNAYK